MKIDENAIVNDQAHIAGHSELEVGLRLQPPDTNGDVLRDSTLCGGRRPSCGFSHEARRC